MEFANIGIEKITSNLGAAVKINRMELGWSQKKLAERARLSREFVSMLEHGKRSPSLEVLQRIAAAFGKDAADLLKQTHNADEKLELAIRLGEIAQSENTDYLRELVAFAQELAQKQEPSKQQP